MSYSPATEENWKKTLNSIRDQTEDAAHQKIYKHLLHKGYHVKHAESQIHGQTLLHRIVSYHSYVLDYINIYIYMLSPYTYFT